jgi:hypothetical protein
MPHGVDRTNRRLSVECLEDRLPLSSASTALLPTTQRVTSAPAQVAISRKDPSPQPWLVTVTTTQGSPVSNPNPDDTHEPRGPGGPVIFLGK